MGIWVLWSSVASVVSSPDRARSSWNGKHGGGLHGDGLPGGCNAVAWGGVSGFPGGVCWHASLGRWCGGGVGGLLVGDKDHSACCGCSSTAWSHYFYKISFKYHTSPNGMHMCNTYQRIVNVDRCKYS